MSAAATLEALRTALGDASDPASEALRARIRRLEGTLTWNLETRYHERLTDIHEDLRELNADVDAMQARYESFVRTRQAATHSYVGYDQPIERLRIRVADALERLAVLMKRQGHLLEEVAIEALDVRRERLVAYRNKARFAFADSSDRAAKKQAGLDDPAPPPAAPAEAE
jgi:chromosome segregation ATPase